MNMSCVSIIEHRYELSILSFPQKLYAEIEFNLDSEIFVNLWSTTYNHIQTYNAYVYIYIYISYIIEAPLWPKYLSSTYRP